MRDEQVEKEFLQQSVLPLLFSSKSANTFVSARNAFKDHGTSIESLQERYDSLSKDDEDFWTDVAEIISDAYDADVPDFSEEEFRDYIKKLLKIRFDKEFRKNDVKKLEDDTDIDSFLSEIAGGNDLVLEDDDSNPRIIYVGERTSREYVEPLQPIDAEFYPPLLIEVDSESGEIQLSGDRDQRNRFVKETSEHDTISLQDEEPEAYDELEIRPDFIQNLKDHDIFLKNIKISGGGSDISMSVASGDGAIDVQDFVDYDLLLQNKQDILSLSSCEFVYITENEDIDFKLNFQTFRRIETNQEFIKIALELPTDHESSREDLEDILEHYGVEVYEPYYKPSAYYFNKLLTTNSNYRSKYLAPLEEMENNNDLDILTDGGIINEDNEEDKITLDKETLASAIQNQLEEAERVDIEINGRQHRIAELEGYEDSRLALVLKSYSDDAEDAHRRFYRVIIPFRARPDNFEKIYNIILSRIDYHKILTSQSEEEVVEYIVRAAQRQAKYHQKMLVEKEARRSAKILSDYLQSPEEFRDRYERPAEAGYVVEDHLNVLFRYLFRDYLYAGGKNEPDGALQLRNKYYLVDSKQRSDLPQSQLIKANQDLVDSKYSDLVESDSMIFVISKELLLSNTESGSLNPDARERVAGDEDASFHFLSVETVYKIYEIFSENTHILSSTNDVREDVFSEIKAMIEESKLSDNCLELEENEENHLGNIRRIIDREDYIPEDRNRYI
ncbi:hypothetical protein [Halorubrum vacuolatum]|uniref:Uncharacterized protein n=1 Tax=Halorubrum vacuolatum TaxID=63740 RepID=A0A238W9C2_HALVU|nr:hypothetical protein [Halorubrum vacuolatum]SNR43195.1 hypothetical protein SAMN06264855_10672 [Halorubrum vacuolatum]